MQMNLLTKQKHTHKHREQIYGYQRGKGWGRDKLGFEIKVYTTMHIIDNQQGPTV